MRIIKCIIIIVEQSTIISNNIRQSYSQYMGERGIKNRVPSNNFSKVHVFRDIHIIRLRRTERGDYYSLLIIGKRNENGSNSVCPELVFDTFQIAKYGRIFCLFQNTVSTGFFLGGERLVSKRFYVSGIPINIAFY